MKKANYTKSEILSDVDVWEVRSKIILHSETDSLVFKCTDVYSVYAHSRIYHLYQNQEKQTMQEATWYIKGRRMKCYSRNNIYPYTDKLIEFVEKHGSVVRDQPHYSNGHFFEPYFPTPEMAHNFHTNFHEKLMEMAKEESAEIKKIIKNKPVLLSGGIDYFREYLESFFKK